MESRADFDAVALRASRYWIEDGLVEMTLGLVFAFQAGLSLAWRIPPIGLSAAGYLLIPWGFKKLKERITYPRCGYVAFPMPSRMRLAFLLFLGVAVIIFSLLWNMPYRELLNRLALIVFMATFSRLIGSSEYKPHTLLDRWLPWFGGLFFGWGISWPGEHRGVDLSIGMLAV